MVSVYCSVSVTHMDSVSVINIGIGHRYRYRSAAHTRPTHTARLTPTNPSLKKKDSPTPPLLTLLLNLLLTLLLNLLLVPATPTNPSSEKKDSPTPPVGVGRLHVTGFTADFTTYFTTDFFYPTPPHPHPPLQQHCPPRA